MPVGCAIFAVVSQLADASTQVDLKADNDDVAGASFRQLLAVGGSAGRRHSMSQKECTCTVLHHKWVRRWHGRWPPRSERSALMIHLRSYKRAHGAEELASWCVRGEMENKVSTEDF